MTDVPQIATIGDLLNILDDQGELHGEVKFSATGTPANCSAGIWLLRYADERGGPNREVLNGLIQQVVEKHRISLATVLKLTFVEFRDALQLDYWTPAGEAWQERLRNRLGIESPPKGDVEIAHSTDFRSIRVLGELYSFTANQAAAIKVLYENYQKGTPDVSGQTLLEAIDHEAPPARLNLVFRGHAAWGRVIVQGKTKGTYRLSIPQ